MNVHLPGYISSERRSTLHNGNRMIYPSIDAEEKASGEQRSGKSLHGEMGQSLIRFLLEFMCCGHQSKGGMRGNEKPVVLQDLKRAYTRVDFQV